MIPPAASSDASKARRGPAAPAIAPAASRLQMLFATTALGLVALPAPPADANPTDPTVRAGSVSIREQGRTLTVDQATGRAIIDWRGFDIAGDETTRFNQPSAAAVALNRVTGADPSRILGRLEANGQLMLVNPNGIVFGPGSRVDVAGLVATTADIRNDDFLAGRYEFTIPSPDPDAAVVNHGTITVAEAGYAALVAPSVRNSGSIEARLGRITLAGAEGFALDLYGDNLVVFRVPVDTAPRDEAGDPVPALVHNTGRVVADGGTVTLAASQVGSVVRSVVNTEGMVQANTISRQGGRIVLGVAGEGDVDVSGAVAAVGDDPGESGGTIEIAGDDVTVADGAAIDARGAAGGGEIGVEALDDATIRMALLAAARIELAADLDRSGLGDGAAAESGGTVRLQDATLDLSARQGIGGTALVTGDHILVDGASLIDASGAGGGGTVLLGGDYQGRGDLRASDRSWIGHDAAIRADAAEAGDGGRVIVWSDDVTRFYGAITARGGATGGDGGLIETSGASLQAFGTADASAPAGQGGTWLLDPNIVFVASLGGSCPGADCSITPGPPELYEPIGDNKLVTVLDTQIETALNAGTNVEITTGYDGSGNLITGGQILVNSPIDVTGPSDVSLSLITDTILINNTIGAIGGGLDLVLDAAGSIIIGAAIQTNGGELDFTAPSISSAPSGSLTTSGGAIAMDGSGFVALGAAVDSGGGDISIDGGAVSWGAAIDTGGGALGLTGTTITHSQAVQTGGGGLSAVASGAYDQNHDIATAGGNVLIDAAGITVDGQTDTGGGSYLAQAAGGSIVVNQAVAGQTGSLTLTADDLAIHAGLSTTGAEIGLTSLVGGILADGSAIQTAGGAISVDSNTTVDLAAALDSGGGAVTVDGTILTLDAMIDSGSGPLDLTGTSIAQNQAIQTSGGAVSIQASGTFDQNHDITTNGGDLTLRAPAITVDGQTTTAGGDYLADAGGGSLDIDDPVETGSGSLAMIADDLVLHNDLRSTSGAISLTSLVGDISADPGVVLDNGTGTITLDAARDIYDIDVDSSGFVRFRADRDVTVNRSISASAVELWADRDGNGVGRLDIGAPISGSSGVHAKGFGVTLDDLVGASVGPVTVDGMSGGIAFASNGGIQAGIGGVSILDTLTFAAGGALIRTNDGPIALQQVIGDAAGTDLQLDAGTGAVSAAGFDLGAAGTLDAAGGTIDIGSQLRADSAVLAGDASGTGLEVAALTLTGAGADLAGSVAGQTGAQAAQATVMPDSETHLVNGCTVSGCPTPAPEPEPVPDPEPEAPPSDPDPEPEPEPEPAGDDGTAGIPPSVTDPTRLVPQSPVESAAPTVGPVAGQPSADGGTTGPSGETVSPETEVAAIESGLDAGSAGGNRAASTDPALMPGFDAGAADLSRLLQTGDLDDGELRRIAEELGDPAVADLARELLTLLDGGDAGGGEIPGDAFGGTATVVLPGIVDFRPAAAPGAPAPAGAESVFRPAGFALFQF